MKLAVFVSLMVVLPFQAEAGSCYRKNVEVEVRNGEGLTGDEPLNPDPYVVVQIGDRTQRTTVIEGNANPVWMQTFHFDDSNSETMIIDVWERDTAAIRGDDDHLGTCKVSLVNRKLFQNVKCTVTGNGVVNIRYKCYEL